MSLRGLRAQQPAALPVPPHGPGGCALAALAVHMSYGHDSV